MLYYVDPKYYLDLRANLVYFQPNGTSLSNLIFENSKKDAFNLHLIFPFSRRKADKISDINDSVFFLFKTAWSNLNGIIRFISVFYFLFTSFYIFFKTWVFFLPSNMLPLIKCMPYFSCYVDRMWACIYYLTAPTVVHKSNYAIK